MVQIIMYRYNITVSLVRILLKNRELYIDEIYGYYKIGNLTTPVIIFHCNGSVPWNHINVFVTSEKKDIFYGIWCDTLSHVEKMCRVISNSR